MALAALAATGLALGGCVAAAGPIVAAGAIGKSSVTKKQRHRAPPRQDGTTAGVPTGTAVLVPGMTALPPPDGVAPAIPGQDAGGGGKVPPGMQYLYGSGEAAALDYQAYLGLIDVMIARSTDHAVGQKVFSAVLAQGATLAAPTFVPCGDKPLAVVFDIDETALLNLGYEADDSQRGGPYDQSRWDRWERTGANAVVATPGMAEVVRVARAGNVTLVFNSNRMAANAAATEAALNGAGLGPVAHGRNLWLQGDEGSGSGKDSRRAAIAARYCVIAMAGDQLGDFSDLFNAPGLTPAQRRALVALPPVRVLWGHGWFVLPNPVYGTGVKGDLDQVFPRDRRWIDPGPPMGVAPTQAPATVPNPIVAAPEKAK